MPNDYSNMKVLVHDSGLFPSVATALAQDFGKVFYFAPWVEQFPVHRRALIGTGLADNIERIYEFWDYVDDVDLVVFTDLFTNDIASHLKKMGKPVWAPMQAELLELARWETREWLKSQGMKMPPCDLISGIDALRDRLIQEEDLWIKTSVFRGDFETFHHVDWRLSRTWIDDLTMQLGPFKDYLDVLVESPFEGIEVGYDGYHVNGKYPSIALYGYEAKDRAYLGKVVPYIELPKPIQESNKILSLKLGDCASFLSTEVRINEEGEYFLNDPCLRCGSPPSESYTELFSNWSDIIWNGANGTMVDPVVRADYIAQLILRTPDARGHKWLPVFYPDSLGNFVKLHNKVVMPEGVFVNNQQEDDDIIGSVIGMGDSNESAIKSCIEHAKEVKALDLEFDESAFDEIMDTIETGRERGVEW